MANMRETAGLKCPPDVTPPNSMAELKQMNFSIETKGRHVGKKFSHFASHVILLFSFLIQGSVFSGFKLKPRGTTIFVADISKISE